jgi:hypothetical protein
MKTEIIEIKDSKYLGDYKLRLKFNDNSVKTVDFSAFLKKSQNPVTRKFLNKTQFKKYELKYGDLIWGDYEMCFPVWDLYKGKI